MSLRIEVTVRVRNLSDGPNAFTMVESKAGRIHAHLIEQGSEEDLAREMADVGGELSALVDTCRNEALDQIATLVAQHRDRAAS